MCIRDSGSTVTNVNTAANGVSIDGEGKVSNVKVKGNNTSVDTVGTKVTVASGVTGTTSNGKDIAAGTTVTTTANGTTGGGSTGGGSTGGDSGDDNPIVDEKEAIENVEANFFSLSDLSFNEDNKIAYTDFEKAYRDAMGSNYTIDNASLEKLEGLKAEDGTVTRANIESVFVNLPWVGIQFTTNEPLTNVTVSYTKDGKSANFAKGNDDRINQATDVLPTSPLEAKGYVVSYVIGDGALTTDAQLGYTGTDAYGTYVFTISGTTEDGETVTVASQSVTYRGGEDAESFVTVNFETEGTMNSVEIYVGEEKTVDLSNLAAPTYTNGEYLFQNWTVDGSDNLEAVAVPENKTITVTAVETKVENAAVRFRADGLWDPAEGSGYESVSKYAYAEAYEIAGVTVDAAGVITVDEATIDKAFTLVENKIPTGVVGMINFKNNNLWVGFGLDAPEGATKFSMGTELKVVSEPQYEINTAETGDAAITYEKIGTVEPATGIVTLGEDGSVLEAAQYIVFYGEDGSVVGVSKLPAFTLKVTPDAQKTADVENLEQLSAAVKDSKVETINLVGDIDFANTSVEVPEKITVVVPADENVALSSTTEEGVQTNALTKPGLTVQGVLDVQGELTVAETAGLQVEGTATVAEDATLVNKGKVVLGDDATLINNGTLTNDGTLDAMADNVVNNGTVGGKVTTVDREISAATIHDHSDAVADENLATEYSATAEKNLKDGVTTIKIKATELKLHQNANGSVGYWVGAFLPAPEDTDWNSVKYSKDGSKYDDFNQSQADYTDENGSYLAYYVNADDADGTAKTFDFYVAWDGNTENAEYFVLDVSGVELAQITALTAENLDTAGDYTTYTLKNGSTDFLVTNDKVKGFAKGTDGAITMYKIVEHQDSDCPAEAEGAQNTICMVSSEKATPHEKGLTVKNNFTGTYYLWDTTGNCYSISFTSGTPVSE